MISSLYTSISAMSVIEANQGITTKNIANQNTVGYKSDTLVTKPFDDVMIANYDTYVNGIGKYTEVGKINWGVRIDDVVTDYTQGVLVDSNNNTDLAIIGEGMFTVTDIEGNTYYTRDGVMKVDGEGYLVTSTGYRVMGVNVGSGVLEPIKVDNKEVSVSADSTLLLDGVDSYKFKIVAFENKDALNRVGNNVYVGVGGVDAKGYSVVGNKKERSNVDILQETTNLMTNMKMYEANQKIVQQIDSILGKIASEVGRV